MKRIVISGAGGFLGREIVRQLVGQGQHEIIVLTRNEKPFLAYGNQITIINAGEYRKIDFGTVDLLLSLAYPTNPKATKALPDGLEYVFSLLTYAAAHGVKGILDISTQSVYGVNRDHVAKESDRPDLDTAYGVGKYCVELLLDRICDPTKVVHLRIASLIGPGLEDRVVNKIIDRVLTGGDIGVIDGNQVFGYMDYRDGANAIITCLNGFDSIEDGERLNIASHRYSLYEIVKCIRGVAVEKGFSPAINDNGGDKQRCTGVDASKMQKMFTWTPRYTLEDSIQTIFEDKMDRD